MSYIGRSSAPLACALALGTLAASTAQAAVFTISVTNPSTDAWSAGLVTLQPLIETGNPPQPSDPTHYATFGFISSNCNAGSGGATADDGDPALLASRWGLTVGVDAWIMPAVPAGATRTVNITASYGSAPGPSVSYIARIQLAGHLFVSIRNAADSSLLSAPLFDGSGNPFAQPAVFVGTYDINKNGTNNGNNSNCQQSCPAPNNCFVQQSNGNTSYVQPVPSTLTQVFAYNGEGSTYTTDGLALGDLTGVSAGTNELVATLNNGQYTGTFNSNNRGRGLVLTQTGAFLSRFDAQTAGHDFMGFPLIETIGTGAQVGFVLSEFAPLAPAPAARDYFVDYAPTTSTSTYGVTNLGYPGFWNMGASSGDVTAAQGGVEIVVPTWTGEIQVRSRAGAALSSLTLCPSVPCADQIYGHVAIADVSPVTSGNEIVAYGSLTGRVYAYKPGSGIVWQSAAPASSSDVAFGSGPAVGTIDGTSTTALALPEIVVASGASNKVYAYDPQWSTSCKYQWTVPDSTDFRWSSPVIGEVDASDGGTFKEIVVLASNGVLSILRAPSSPGAAGSCPAGTVVWSVSLEPGSGAWFTPVLASLAGNDTVLDIVAATYHTINVVNVTGRQIAYRATVDNAQFYPSAVVDTVAGRGAIFVSGWANGTIYRFDTPSGAPLPASWPTFMGDNRRTGFR